MKNLCRLLHCSLLALLVSASTAHNPIHPIGVPDPIHQLPSDLPSSIPTSTQTPTATKSTINTPPKCTLSENDLATTLNMTFTDTDSSTGKQITADVNQVISKPDNHGYSQSSMSLTVYLNSSIVFSTSHTTSTNGTVDASINWAALTHTATFNIDPKNNTAGTLDSHPFSLGPLKSFNSSAHLITKRNQPLLQITPEPQYNISIPQLQAGITKGMQACQAQVTAHYGSSTINSILIPRDDRTQDLGHFSDTYDASSCVNCEVLATAGIALSETICIAATCWWSFGVGCVACYTAAATGEFYALANCNFSGACCPITCGSGSYPVHTPTCCFGNEECLDSQQGRCCAQGQRTCAGKECCNADQSCLEAGPMMGSCCPPNSVCGELCCPHASDVCTAGDTQCCAAGDTCGTSDPVCCNPIDPTSSAPGFALGNFCADPSRKLCCRVDQVAVDGICCHQGEFNCDGSCCLGSCSPTGQCVPNPTTAQCLALGYEGTCDDVPGCRDDDGGNVCESNGCCQIVPK